MKRLVFLAFILCCIVQAQTIGTWRNASNNVVTAIYSPNVNNGNTTLSIRCTGEILEIFFTTEAVVETFRSIYYKIDMSIITETSIYGYSKDFKGIFFDSIDNPKLLKSFLFGHYFSVVVSLSDRLQSYTFDLTGFGQAVKALPCALKILNP